jgi:hypothetical protein
MILLNPLLITATLKQWRTHFLLFVYVLILILLFVSYVQPSVLGLNGLRIGADTSTYMDAAEDFSSSSNRPISIPMLISFQGQILGPVAESVVLKTTTNIALVNGLIFVVGLWYASRLPGVRIELCFPLLILNPTTTVSILTLNKEIFAYISIIFFIRYLTVPGKSHLLLFTALCAGLMARWEQPAIMMLYLFVEHRWSPLKGKHKTGLIMMVGAITLLWPFLLRTGVVNLASLLSTADNAQSNSLPMLNAIQASFGFPIVLIPKMIGNMFGVSWNPVFLVGLLQVGDFSDVQNQIISPIQNLVMLVVCLTACFKHKLQLYKASVYTMWLYLIMSAAAPIYQPRYQFPIYVLICLELSGLISPRTETTTHPRLAGLRKRFVLCRSEGGRL